MARSDLLISLVKASVTGDKRAVRTAAEAIAAEERQKQHNVLAERLTNIIQSNGNGLHTAPMNEQPARGKEYLAEIVARKTLEDIVLTATCRTAIDQLIEEQQRASLLRAHGLDPRHRVLLIGPPGNGKTSLAEAIAETLAVPFFVVRYEAMIGSYLGETASRLKRVFDYARTTPCVLFFDEFDALGKERGDTHETGEIKRVVTTLLMQVDEVPAYTVIVAATNHSELLDRAAWRRFQLRLTLPAPNRKEVAAYFDRFIGTLEATSKLSGDALSKRIGPISYAEAEEFTLDVRRRLAFAQGAMSADAVIAAQLALWEERAQPTEHRNKRSKRGGTPNPGTTSAD
jgi:SpoVK/Ycf46/Vps4 family AAA+-type ATPase